MNYVKINYVDFVPNKCVKDCEVEGVYVFSHKKNKRIYKKCFLLGRISLSKFKEYLYQPLNIHCGLTIETMMIIVSFLRQLNDKEILFDSEKGELEQCENKR